MTFGLGRIYIPDPAAYLKPMRAVLPTRSSRTVAYWVESELWLNQGQKPECVAYGSQHYLADGPIQNYVRNPLGPAENPDTFYAKCQAIDGIPGPHDGSTVHAAARVLESEGYISSYHWASYMTDVVTALLDVGPVLVGSDWTEGMFNPTLLPDGNYRLMPSAGDKIAGGHCYLLNGIDTRPREWFPHGFVRVKNSWGTGWAKHGTAHMPIEVAEELLFSGSGEAMLAIEVQK